MLHPTMATTGVDRLRTSLTLAAEAIRSGGVSSQELAEACLERARAVEPRLHAFAWLDAADVRRRAAAVDGSPPSPGTGLRGVPIGVKDIFDTAGVPTECGSSLLAGRVPERSAAAVGNLEAGGAFVFGKTVTAELAYLRPGPTRNPWDLQRTPGGSSMGSAAAVAAGIVPGAIGSQTAGSVIRPAAFCGVVGFKPTLGRLPTARCLELSRTLDHVGCFAQTVQDVGLLAAAAEGEPGFELPARMSAPSFLVARTNDWEFAEEAARIRFEADVARLRSAGSRLEEASLPAALDAARSVHRRILAVEASRALAGLVAGHEGEVGAALADLLAEGRRMSDSDYQEALAERRELMSLYGSFIDGFDAMLTPPALGEAPPADTTGDSRFCVRWTLLGVPAVVIPSGLGPARLPLGLQLVGRAGKDDLLLAAA